MVRCAGPLRSLFDVVNFVWKYFIVNFMKYRKTYGFVNVLSTKCLKQISSDQKSLILQNDYQLGNPTLSSKLSFVSAKGRANLNIFE